MQHEASEIDYNENKLQQLIKCKEAPKACDFSVISHSCVWPNLLSRRRRL